MTTIFLDLASVTSSYQRLEQVILFQKPEPYTWNPGPPHASLVFDIEDLDTFCALLNSFCAMLEERAEQEDPDDIEVIRLPLHRGNIVLTYRFNRIYVDLGLWCPHMQDQVTIAAMETSRLKGTLLKKQADKLRESNKQLLLAHKREQRRKAVEAALDAQEVAS